MSLCCVGFGSYEDFSAYRALDTGCKSVIYAIGSYCRNFFFCMRKLFTCYGYTAEFFTADGTVYNFFIVCCFFTACYDFIFLDCFSGGMSGCIYGFTGFSYFTTSVTDHIACVTVFGTAYSICTRKGE